MVDVGAKPATARTARAAGTIRMSAEAYALVAANGVKKGDVLGVARVAGVMAAKRTAELIPLCHQIVLTHADVACALDPALPGVRVEATARTVGPTGVEMEALTAVSVALLTVYDMVKAADAAMEIGAIRLLDKTGGSGWDAVPNPVRDLHRAGPPTEGARAGVGPAPTVADDAAAPSGAARRSDTPPNPTQHA
jgi:cyclic pyranopterin phosphate synthase